MKKNVILLPWFSLVLLKKKLKSILKQFSNFENLLGKKRMSQIQMLGSIHLEWLEMTLIFSNSTSVSEDPLKITFIKSYKKEIVGLEKYLFTIDIKQNYKEYKTLDGCIISFCPMLEFITNVRKNAH